MASSIGQQQLDALLDRDRALVARARHDNTHYSAGWDILTSRSHATAGLGALPAVLAFLAALGLIAVFDHIRAGSDVGSGASLQLQFERAGTISSTTMEDAGRKPTFAARMHFCW